MKTSTSEASVLDADHVRWCCPIVGIDVAHWPLLGDFVLLVLLPVVIDQVPQGLGCFDLLKSGAGVVLLKEIERVE